MVVREEMCVNERKISHGGMLTLIRESQKMAIRSHHKLEYARCNLYDVYSCDANLVLDCIRFNS